MNRYPLCMHFARDNQMTPRAFDLYNFVGNKPVHFHRLQLSVTMEFEKEIKETSVEWNEGAVYALGLYKRAASILGIWPTQNRTTSAIRIGIYITFQLTSVSILLKKFIDYGLCGTPIEIVNTGTICLSSVQISMKAYIAWNEHDKFLRIVNSAVSDWSRSHDEQSGQIMLKYAHIGRILVYTQLGACLIAAGPVVLTMLPALVEITDEINNETIFMRNIPVAPRCWISIETDLYLYYAYWTSVAMFAFSMSFATVCTNGFLYGFGVHVYSQFELLYLSANGLQGTEDYAEQRKFIRKFSKRHAELLNLANDLEDGGNLIILSEVCAIIIIASIAGVMLLIALNVGDSEVISNMGMRMVLVMTQLFIYNYMGEQLSNQSEKIQNAIYSCPWYKLSYHTVQDLKLIIVRSNHPFRLTAGKLVVMNYMSFKETVKSMFSFFSVLRLMLQG